MWVGGQGVHQRVEQLEVGADAVAQQQRWAGADGPPVVFTHGCGEALRPVLCCEACGGRVDSTDLALVGSADSVHSLPADAALPSV